MPSWLQAFLYIGSAIILLRIGGKRTISQATPSEVAIMIGIGTVLVHPLKSENVWTSIYHGTLIIIGLLIISYIQIHMPKSKRWILGEPMLLIKDGIVLHENLKKARVTEDELKMKLRIKKINDISIVKSATIEVSGDIGIEINPDQSFATKKDIEEIKNAILVIGNSLNAPIFFYTSSEKQENNLFRQAGNVQDKDPSQ